MTNYQNDIMDLLSGETPRQKHDYLMELLKIFNENNSGTENVLLSVCDKLEKTGSEMFKASGSDSYEERCHIHDAQMKIYSLTNKCKIEKMNYIQWREQVQSKL